MDDTLSSGNYISPHITKCTSLKALLDEKDPHGYFSLVRGVKLSFDDLFSQKRVFVVTEPGYGKTRLLKEIVVKAEGLGKQGIFIDLKKADRAYKDLKDFIFKKINVTDEVGASTNLQNTSLFKTPNFILKNSEKVVVCLDALDEVKSEDFFRTVEIVKDFSKKYKNIFLFVSCRYHHCQKYQELFSDFNFDYIRITPFTIEQVCKYFEMSGLLKNDIDKVIQALEFRGRDLVIQTPRYLEMMVERIKEEGVGHLSKLTKAEIFEWFIYRKLDIEGKKLNFQRKEIIKRVLEKIALLMEMYQTNVLTKEELITIFDDVKSNLNISFLQQVPLEFFYERTVLKDNIDTVEFENTEFQEYLAAKEILRLGKTEQIVFDLAVNQELREVYPSWFNTLSFLVDLDISLLTPLLDFGASKREDIQDEEYHRFLTKVNIDRLTGEERKEIFKNVFMYYQYVLHWLPFDVVRNLSYYFDVSQNKLLKDSIVGTDGEGAKHFVRKGNVACLVAFLLEREILSESQKDYWKNKLIEFVKDKNKNGVLQREALFALGKFKDIKLIKKIPDLINSPDESIVQSFIRACIEANPNDFFSIQSFVEGTKKRNTHARYGLYQVKEKRSIKELLEYFVNDSSFVFQFVDQEGIFEDRDEEIILNIRNVWDDEIKNKLNSIITAAFSGQYWYQAEKSRTIRDMVLLLGERKKDYIFELLKSIKDSKELQKNLFSFENIFALLLKKQQVGRFIEKLKKLEHGQTIALGILRTINLSKRENAKGIYEEGRKHFKDEYAQLEKMEKKQLQRMSKEENIYKKFKFKLEPSEGKYYPDVFRFYLDNKEQIDLRITQDDKRRLKHLITNSIFTKFDPGQHKLTISRRETGGATSYTTHGWIPVFGDCLIAAQELRMNISKYRKRIINYIPFAYSDHLRAIFALIPRPKAEEINSLLKVYKGECRDDLSRFMPSSFIEACKNYNMAEAIPILKEFVEQADFSTYERCSALEIIMNIGSQKEYLKKIFKQYKNKKQETFRIAEVANKYLVEKFSDDTAIRWRFKQLKERIAPFTRPKEVHWHKVLDVEGELRDKEFARPLMTLKNPKYKTQFLKLLDESFTVLKKGENYWPYVTYLWEIVFAYFDNLKESRAYSHLKDLENYIQKLSSQGGMNWFRVKVKELRRRYMDYIGKPQNISECIKQYNKLKEDQYLDISTPRDLVEIVKEVVNRDIKRFVEEEGFYKTIQDVKGRQESLIQKTLTTQLEYGFSKRGFRENEISIRREGQLLDDKRTDFLISYGFVGPVLIEVKRTDNQEITNGSKRKQYKGKLLQYIKGTKSHFGLFVLFQIKEDYPLEECLPEIKEIYKDCENVEIIGLNCLK